MIENKVVIITGASSGIGEATAKLLASKGAKVVLGTRREDKLKRIAEEIGKAGGRFCQGSRHRLWPTRVRLGIGPLLTKGADEDAVLGMRVGSCDRATGAHRPGLPPVPLPRMRQAVQRALRHRAEPHSV